MSAGLCIVTVASNLRCNSCSWPASESHCELDSTLRVFSDSTSPVTACRDASAFSYLFYPGRSRQSSNPSLPSNAQSKRKKIPEHGSNMNGVKSYRCSAA